MLGLFFFFFGRQSFSCFAIANILLDKTLDITTSARGVISIFIYLFPQKNVYLAIKKLFLNL